MILAAGFGTRLAPYTETLPKALVPFCGEPMIKGVIEKMKNFGIKKIVVNVHHHREKLIEYLTGNDFGAEIIISDEKDEHLLTGGGIKNAISLFGESENVLIHNADIVSSIDYGALLEYHRLRGAFVTLAVRKKNDERVLLFDENDNLAGWKNKTSGETKFRMPVKNTVEFGFTGVYAISRKAFEFFPQENKFDIIDFFLNPDFDFPVIGYRDASEYWFDLGSTEKIKEAEKYFGCNKND